MFPFLWMESLRCSIDTCGGIPKKVVPFRMGGNGEATQSKVRHPHCKCSVIDLYASAPNLPRVMPGWNGSVLSKPLQPFCWLKAYRMGLISVNANWVGLTEHPHHQLGEGVPAPA